MRVTPKSLLAIATGFLALSWAGCSLFGDFSNPVDPKSPNYKPAPLPPPPMTVLASFGYTGSPQIWVVPAGVTKIRVTAVGAAGGLGGSAAPGAGGMMVADFPVVSGQSYTISVGGVGGTGGHSGWNGGGACVLGGCTIAGGATDLRYLGNTLANRILVVGGGGGVGANGLNFGGFGAGTYNASGGNGQNDPTESAGGVGGTQASGGVGGTGNYGVSPAPSGTAGVGASNSNYGGGGGGGYYGGGSGGSGFSGGHSGGGGGSSYLDIAYGVYVSGVNGFNSSSDGSLQIANISP